MTVRVWDPLLRLFHWGLVGAVAVAWLSSEEGQPLHQAAGYVAAGLIAFRLLWGFIGPRYARFAQFIHGPAAVAGYLGAMLRGRERRYLGHNPAGAVMIVALLLSLSGTIFTGWLMAEPNRLAMLPTLPAAVSPAFAEEHESGSRGAVGAVSVKDLHGALADLTLLLVALHLVGVAFASLRHNENLARAMVTGRKRAPDPDDVS
ncbi:MAG: cytochrome B [Rhodobacteraceae bacterium]|nr:cytochrome B [Paracoccaceae bacterium]